MSILTDVDIRDLLDKKRLLIEPFCENCLTPIGYDLRVGRTYKSASATKGENLNDHEKICIAPRETVLIHTFEKVIMPKDKTISALVLSKVSLVSKGIAHIATTVDADWDQEEFLVAITNNSNKNIFLKSKDQLCTIVFFTNLSPSSKPSDKEPRRNDIYLKKFHKQESIQKRKKLLIRLIPTAILVSFVLFAVLYFGPDKTETVTTITAGAALSNMLYYFLKI